MLKNIVIVALVVFCAYLLLRLYGPQYLPDRFGSKEDSREKSGPGKEAHSAPSLPIEGTPPKPMAAPRPGQAEEAVFGSRVLRKGMSGPDVAQLQERLKLAGFVHELFTPGVFDDATEQAVLEYQTGNAFLAEMYGFHGLPAPHTPHVDGVLARQLLKVPTPNKVAIRYTVAPKENLFRIATKFGIGVESIKYLNNLKDANAVKVGQSLLTICDRSKAM